jgi:uncharacterized protein
MKVGTSAIPPEGVHLVIEMKAPDLPGLQQMTEDERCEFNGPLRVSVDLVPRGELFVADGAFDTRVRLTCDRCLAPFDTRLSGSFGITFAPDPEETRSAGEDAVEVSEEEVGTVFFDGEHIDLGPVVEEQVLMSFPMQVLCGSGCLGLCPGCGVDLNVEKCRCEGPTVDPRLAVLKALRGHLPE